MNLKNTTKIANATPILDKLCIDGSNNSSCRWLVVQEGNHFLVYFETSDSKSKSRTLAESFFTKKAAIHFASRMSRIQSSNSSRHEP